MESLKDKNLLFVVDKPINISSRGYINKLKRVYGQRLVLLGHLTHLLVAL